MLETISLTSLAWRHVDLQFLGSNKNGQRMKGGIFSRDGVRATTFGYGLVAQEFIDVM